MSWVPAFAGMSGWGLKPARAGRGTAEADLAIDRQARGLRGRAHRRWIVPPRRSR